MSVAAMKSDLAVLRRAQGARLGRGARRRRHHRAADDRHQRADVDDEVERPADPGRGPRGRDRRARRRNPPGARSAVDPRCRLQRARHRPHRHHQCRPRQHRDFARPQAVDHQRRVRGAGHVPEGAARQGPLPARRLGAGGGRTAVARAAARACRRAARSGHQPRHADRAGHARHAAQGRSRARLVDLHDRHGRGQLRRRAHRHGPQGRGGRCSRSTPTTRATGSAATSRSTASRPISTTASRATPTTPRSACRRRSTRPRAASSAST